MENFQCPYFLTTCPLLSAPFLEEQPPSLPSPSTPSSHGPESLPFLGVRDAGSEGLVSVDPTYLDHTPPSSMGISTSSPIASYSTSLPEISKNDDQLQGGKLGDQTAFVSKLWHIANHSEYEQHCCWSQDGKSLLLGEGFTELLPRFFKHGKFSSFIRQLNMYSFARGPVRDREDAPNSSSSPSSHHQRFLSPSSESQSSSSSHRSTYGGGVNGSGGKTFTMAFSHPLFQRNHPELLGQLRPRIAGKSSRSSSGPYPSRKQEESHRRSSARRGTSR